MIDIDPILCVLHNYHVGFVLNQDEMDMLRAWREESDAHEKLFQELNIAPQAAPTEDLREQIRRRLMEMEEMGE
jgi:hypothetical protein